MSPPALRCARMETVSAPIATSPSNSSASPRPPRWPPSRWVGRGDKKAADGAAVDAMRLVLGTVPMDGVVVIGEGEKDEAPMLYNGEEIGDGTPPPSTSPSTRSTARRSPSLGSRQCHRR